MTINDRREAGRRLQRQDGAGRRTRPRTCRSAFAVMPPSRPCGRTGAGRARADEVDRRVREQQEAQKARNEWAGAPAAGAAGTAP